MTAFFRSRWIFRVHLVLLLPALIMALFLAGDLALNPALTTASSFAGQISSLLAGLVIAPLTIGVGLFCVRRVPGNVVGPVLALWGCGIIQIISTRSTAWIDAHETVYAGIIWPACFFLFSYFPDGRVYPRRYEKLVDGMLLFTYAMGILVGLSSEAAFFAATPTRNLLFIQALDPFRSLFFFGNTAGAILGLLFSVVSLTLRYRAADISVRQQVKWLLAGLLPLVLLMLPGQLLQQVPTFASVGSVLSYLGGFWLMTFPVIAIGNAMLRHRLYDVDIIIRRTLVYSILTTLLAGVYFGGVVVLQALLRPLTGEGTDLAVAVSTLAIAALFQPLRRRIQATIDRRFYRRKYNARKILQAFGARLRDEVDRDVLTEDMLGVVDQTLQPAHVSLWLRDEGSKSDEQRRVAS